MMVRSNHGSLTLIWTRYLRPFSTARPLAPAQRARLERAGRRRRLLGHGQRLFAGGTERSGPRAPVEIAAAGRDERHAEQREQENPRKHKPGGGGVDEVR